MRKRNNIDWLQDDVEQALKRSVKNYNAKIDRERKKDPQNASIPAKVSYSEIKANIRTKGGANRQIAKLQKYTQRSTGKAKTKGSGFQLSGDDQDTLRKLVKNHNAKITRIEKNDPLSRGLLPDKVTVKELQGQIKSRKDFNRIVKETQAFTQRGGEYLYNWTARDEARLTKAVNEFNAELERLRKANPKLKTALPDRATVTQYKKVIATPEDLNRELRSLRAFKKKENQEIIEIPENKYNLKATKWQIEEMQARAERVNAARAKRREEFEKLPATHFGKDLGYRAVEGGAGFGSEAQRGLDPINPFTPHQGRTDLSAKQRTLMNADADMYWLKRDAIMKKNYIKAIDNNFNPDDPRVKAVKQKIKNMDPREFYKTFLSEQSKFEAIYKDNPAHMEALVSTWLPDR